ncbi:hypothetical protein B0H17DRAFT_1102445 [Mycena rosella]|uniref:Uncharacterized protein n=1 Tax=Mycena rosella TaxID=1033263 RepID=A0AAD7G167_MYCRO|nr:hypothetical protein B0H17DRAFT_1102445 [Mycena rosella]
MPTFTKTVSSLTKAHWQLLSAAATFGFDTAGSTDALKARLKMYMEANKAVIMAKPDYSRPFTCRERDDLDVNFLAGFCQPFSLRCPLYHVLHTDQLLPHANEACCTLTHTFRLSSSPNPLFL